MPEKCVIPGIKDAKAKSVGPKSIQSERFTSKGMRLWCVTTIALSLYLIYAPIVDKKSKIIESPCKEEIELMNNSTFPFKVAKTAKLASNE